MASHILTARLDYDISPIPFSDSDMVLWWITVLFPDPTDDKSMAEAIELAERGRLQWRLSFFQPDISALLASIMVNGTNLRHVFLWLAGFELEPTFTQLLLSKIAYDAAIGVETFPKLRRFSMAPYYTENEVPLLPNLRYFALHYATDEVSLRLQPLRCAELGTLQTLAFHHVYDAGQKAQQVLSHTSFPLLKVLCIMEWRWDNQLSYPRLISLISERCRALETFVFDFTDKLDNDSPNNKPKPALSTLQNVASTRIHIDHLPNNYQDLVVILAPEQPAWPVNATRLEITGLTVHMLDSIAVAYAAGLPIEIDLGSVKSLRLVFDSSAMQNIPLDHEIQQFVNVLANIIDMAQRKDVYIGVYLTSRWRHAHCRSVVHGS